MALVPMALVCCAEAADEERASVGLSVSCINYAGTLKTLKVVGGKPFKLSTANVIDAGTVPVDDGMVRLFSEDGGQAAASIAVNGIRKPIAILLPSAGQKEEPYRSVVIDGNPAVFPLGSTCFVNLGAHSIRIRIGKKVIVIPAGESAQASPTTDPGEAAALTIECKPDEHWLLVSSSRWAHRKDRRSLATIYQDSRSGRTLVKSIPLRE